MANWKNGSMLNSAAGANPHDGKTGIIIPLYQYPTNVYTNTALNNLIALIKKYNDVPVTVILNPNSGPDTVVDANYAALLKRLQGAGATVIGYVDTAYENKTIAAVAAEIDTWLALYPGIEGIFLDEMSNTGTAASVSYYRTLTDYIHDKKLSLAIGNPGAGIPESYFIGKACDKFMIFENAGYPAETDLAGDYAGGYADYDYANRGALMYAAALNLTSLQMVRKYVGDIYLTDASSANAYSVLPTYMEALFELLRPGSADNFIVSGSADPTTSTIPDGTAMIYKNTTTAVVKLWVNDGGVLKSVALA